MATESEYKCAVACICFTLDNQVSEQAGRAFYHHHWHGWDARMVLDANQIGSLLRDGGVDNMSMVVEPYMVQGVITASIRNLCAALMQVKHPHHGGALRWLCAYGMGPEGLFTQGGFEPTDPDIGPAELWPNVTGQVVVLLQPSPHAFSMELVDLSADLSEEGS